MLLMLLVPLHTLKAKDERGEWREKDCVGIGPDLWPLVALGCVCGGKVE